MVRISLTESGKALFEAIDSYIRKRLKEILSCLSDEEMSTFLGLIDKVVTGLRETVR